MNTDGFAPIQERRTRMIDETLKALGNQVPSAGLEGRIAIGIAHARQEGAHKGLRGFSFSRLAITGMSCGIVCAAIVAGSVHHSRATLPAAPDAGIRLLQPSGGVGAASAAHLATKHVSPSGRPRAMRKSTDGRATVSPEAQKRAGETVPQQP